ncbi:hypothetical protein [Caulobacter sp. 1776]|uniref:hypothetical protein n=1 Tax=Caulobacter sp. 1776 TaxID=3156420 RepID=UPI00339340B5
MQLNVAISPAEVALVGEAIINWGICESMTWRSLEALAGGQRPPIRKAMLKWGLAQKIELLRDLVADDETRALTTKLHSFHQAVVIERNILAHGMTSFSLRGGTVHDHSRYILASELGMVLENSRFASRLAAQIFVRLGKADAMFEDPGPAPIGRAQILSLEELSSPSQSTTSE